MAGSVVPGVKRQAVKRVPLTDACRRLRCGYAVAYDYYLRGRLKGGKVKKRILVTVKSVDALRAELGLAD